MDTGNGSTLASIAASARIPRETVRRTVRRLEGLNKLVVGDSGWLPGASADAYFERHIDGFVEAILKTADQIRRQEH